MKTDQAWPLTNDAKGSEAGLRYFRREVDRLWSTKRNDIVRYVLLTWTLSRWVEGLEHRYR